MNDPKEQEFKTIINSYPEGIQEIAIGVRKKLYEILPQVVEIIWERQKTAGYGTGPKKNSEHFCWIQLTKNHVNLGFNYGTELPDPHNLLEGTGKKFRHIKIRNRNQVNDQELVELIKFATTHKIPPIST